MIGGEPFSGSAEAAHHFVADEEDSVTIADLAQALEIAIRRDDDAVRSCDRLDENRGDGLRSFVHQCLFDLVEAATREHLVAVALAIEMAAVFVGIEKANDAGKSWFICPAARIAGQ